MLLIVTAWHDRSKTCSHIATLFWTISTGIEKHDSLIVTQQSPYWVIPPAVKKAPYATVASIDFVGKRKRLHPSTITAKSTANSDTLSSMVAKY